MPVQIDNLCIIYFIENDWFHWGNSNFYLTVKQLNGKVTEQKQSYNEALLEYHSSVKDWNIEHSFDDDFSVNFLFMSALCNKYTAYFMWYMLMGTKWM